MTKEIEKLIDIEARDSKLSSKTFLKLESIACHETSFVHGFYQKIRERQWLPFHLV